MPETSLEQLVRELKEAGFECGAHSWSEISARMGVDKSLLVKLTKHGQRPTVATIQKAAKALAPEKENHWLRLAGYDYVPAENRTPSADEFDFAAFQVALKKKSLSPKTIEIVIDTIREQTEIDSKRPPKEK